MKYRKQMKEKKRETSSSLSNNQLANEKQTPQFKTNNQTGLKETQLSHSKLRLDKESVT
jgi:hypothetical protein